jgi:hypothetical protein
MTASTLDGTWEKRILKRAFAIVTAWWVVLTKETSRGKSVVSVEFVVLRLMEFEVSSAERNLMFDIAIPKLQTIPWKPSWATGDTRNLTQKFSSSTRINNSRPFVWYLFLFRSTKWILWQCLWELLEIVLPFSALSNLLETFSALAEFAASRFCTFPISRYPTVFQPYCIFRLFPLQTAIYSEWSDGFQGSRVSVPHFSVQELQSGSQLRHFIRVVILRYHTSGEVWTSPDTAICHSEPVLLASEWPKFHNGMRLRLPEQVDSSAAVKRREVPHVQAFITKMDCVFLDKSRSIHPSWILNAISKMRVSRFSCDVRNSNGIRQNFQPYSAGRKTSFSHWGPNLNPLVRLKSCTPRRFSLPNHERELPSILSSTSSGPDAALKFLGSLASKSRLLNHSSHTDRSFLQIMTSCNSIWILVYSHVTQVWGRVSTSITHSVWSPGSAAPSLNALQTMRSISSIVWIGRIQMRT